MARIIPPQPTATQLAADPALTSEFVSRITIPGSGGIDFISSSVVRIGEWPGREFTNGADEFGLYHVGSIPVGWTSVNVDFRWSASAAGTGNVRWYTNPERPVPGQSLVTGPGGLLVTDASEGSATLAETRMATGLTIPEGASLNLAVGRFGTDPADTLAVPAVLLAIVISPA